MSESCSEALWFHQLCWTKLSLSTGKLGQTRCLSLSLVTTSTKSLRKNQEHDIQQSVYHVYTFVIILFQIPATYDVPRKIIYTQYLEKNIFLSQHLLQNQCINTLIPTEKAVILCYLNNVCWKQTFRACVSKREFQLNATAYSSQRSKINISTFALKKQKAAKQFLAPQNHKRLV